MAEFEDDVRIDEAIWNFVAILVDRMNDLQSTDESLKTRLSELEFVSRSAATPTLEWKAKSKDDCEVENLGDVVRRVLLALEDSQSESRMNAMRLDARCDAMREELEIVKRE